MITLGPSFLLQAGASAPAADSGVLAAGIGTGSELTLVAVLTIALVGGAVAMLVGDVVKRRDDARRRRLLGPDV